MAMVHGTLEDWVKEMDTLVHAHGLVPLPTEFHMVSDEDIYTLSSYYAPGRYQHWTHGERYWIAKQRDEQGMGRIYELVVNGDPALAYLLDKNADAHNVLVIGHVLAHTDFFARNHYLSSVRRPNIGIWFREHAEWLQDLHRKRSFSRVEKLIDAAHTLAQLVDPHYRAPELLLAPESVRPRGKSFDWVRDLYESTAAEPEDDGSYMPAYKVWPSSHDVLALVADLGHLGEEERMALRMLREEMLYFQPQAQTKFMNEGWATFWHVRLIREFSLWDEQDHIEAMRMHAMVTQSHNFFNPYYFGWTLWELLAEMHGLETCFRIVEDQTDLQWVNQWITPELVRLAQDKNVWPLERPRNPQDPPQNQEMEYYPAEDLARDVQRAFLPDTPEIFVEQIDAQSHRLDLIYHGEKPLHKEYTQDVLNAIAYLWGGDVMLTSVHKIWYGNEADWRRRA
jgi:stage V sporulation protein R